jgi:hypothetical protein
MLTQERVLELFDYQEGNLYWKKKANSWKEKLEVGSINGQGKKTVWIDKKNYLVHRVIFLWHKGYLPNEIDHIDCDKLNNSIDNLREVTHTENCPNKKIYKNNTTGSKGVYKPSDSPRWMATIQANKKTHYLGMFDTAELAKEFRDLVAMELHGEFARA